MEDAAVKTRAGLALPELQGVGGDTEPRRLCPLGSGRSRRERRLPVGGGRGPRRLPPASLCPLSLRTFPEGLREPGGGHTGTPAASPVAAARRARAPWMGTSWGQGSGSRAWPAAPSAGLCSAGPTRAHSGHCPSQPGTPPALCALSVACSRSVHAGAAVRASSLFRAVSYSREHKSPVRHSLPATGLSPVPEGCGGRGGWRILSSPLRQGCRVSSQPWTGSCVRR